MIVLAALLTTNEGKGDKLEEELKSLALEARKEPGTITYEVHRMIDNPSRFFILERYDNEESLQAHMETLHFKKYRENVADIVKTRDVGIYRIII